MSGRVDLKTFRAISRPINCARCKAPATHLCVESHQPQDVALCEPCSLAWDAERRLQTMTPTEKALRNFDELWHVFCDSPCCPDCHAPARPR